VKALSAYVLEPFTRQQVLYLLLALKHYFVDPLNRTTLDTDRLSLGYALTDRLRGHNDRANP